MFFDSNYLLWVMLPTLVLSGLAQMFVRSAYSKWSQQRNASGLTGAQVGERIIRSAGLTGVGLEITPGQLSDHYDPRTHVVRMSQDVAVRPSVAAMAIVAHELGHAQQHAQKSGLIVARNFLLPAVQISPMISYGMIFGGLLLNLTGLMWLGVVVFGVSVVFMLLTLPVEIDASLRGLRLLKASGLFQTTEDQSGARNVLTAAALTYVAAAVTSVLTLLYYISMVRRSD